MLTRKRDVAGRPSWATAVAVVGLTLGILVSVQPDGAPPAQRLVAAVTDVPVSADPLPTVQIDGVVWNQAMGRDGTTVYAVGSFATARPAGSAAGVRTVARRNFVAFDITTGVMTTFDANLNSTVRAVAVAPTARSTSVATSRPRTVWPATGLPRSPRVAR